MKIYLYNEIQDLDFEHVVEYVKAKCPLAELELRGSFISHFYSQRLIKELSDAWQTDLPGEGSLGQSEEERLEYELGLYKNPQTVSSSVLYNGWSLLELLQAQIPRNEAAYTQLHIFLTPRLMVTKDDRGRRFHARTIMGWQPTVISSSGLVEAPARSMEYYIFQAGYKVKGEDIPESVMKKKFEGRFLDYNDPRLTEVVKGYLLQGIAYRFFGEGFCEDPRCRLFNAHRQSEMLTAQLETPEFCPRHKVLFA